MCDRNQGYRAYPSCGANMCAEGCSVHRQRDLLRVKFRRVSTAFEENL